MGGGYPEVFIKELSENKSMINSIKKALDNGLPCYAECGGLMYLTDGEKSEDIEHISHSTVGFFKGYYTLTKKLQNFGYAEIKVEVENNILPQNISINCHEFHKSFVNLQEEKIYKLYKTIYDGTQKNWKCGYVKKNTLGAYGHVHFFGNLEWFRQILNKV